MTWNATPTATSGTSLRRWRSWFGRATRTTALAAVILAGCAGAAIATTPLRPAHAATKQIWSELEDDGSVTTLYQDDDGHVWAIFTYTDGTFEVYDHSDSNPDDPSGTGEGKTAADIVKEIEKLHGTANADWHLSLLGKLMDKNGKTVVVYWNPPESAAFDDGYGGASTGLGFDPEGGSIGQQIINKGKHGSNNGGSGNNDGSDDNLKPGDVGLWTDDMPGPPPLVNPNPVRTRVAVLQFLNAHPKLAARVTG